MAKRRRKRYHPPGTVPGTLAAHAEAGNAPVRLRAFLYDAERCEERAIAVSDIPSLSPPKTGVLWLDVAGLSDPGVVRAIGDRFGIHPLAQEDVLNVPQRPKVEWYGDRLLVVLWQVRPRNLREQLSFFVSERLVVSFQESPDDSLEPVRERIRHGSGRIRTEGADYLLYSLCDAVLDAFFPTLERLGDKVEELEDRYDRHPRSRDVRLHPEAEEGADRRSARVVAGPGRDEPPDDRGARPDPSRDQGVPARPATTTRSS